MNDQPHDEKLRNEKSFSNRLLRYSFLASVLLNMGWIFWVAHSDIFGSGSFVDTLHPQTIKVVKPIPVRPKPKPPKPLPPPPPPPTPKIQPKIKPLKPIVHPPRPVPRPRPIPTRPVVRPHPQPPTHQPPRQMAVVTTSNKHTATPFMMHNVAPADTGHPTTSGTSDKPIDKPADKPIDKPVDKPIDKPIDKPVVLDKPIVKHDPPVMHHPDNWVPIDMQNASVPNDVRDNISTGDIDSSTLTNDKIVISLVIDGTGHVQSAHIKEGCGNSDLDNRVLEAVKRVHCTPAIQDHIPREVHMNYTYPVSVG